MNKHKWEYPNNITSICLKCNITRLKLKSKYGNWEYLTIDGLITYKKPECKQSILNESNIPTL